MLHQNIVDQRDIRNAVEKLEQAKNGDGFLVTPINIDADELSADWLRKKQTNGHSYE
jgi:hypothetical protein